MIVYLDKSSCWCGCIFVVAVHFPVDHLGRSSGDAFVELSDEDSVRWFNLQWVRFFVDRFGEHFGVLIPCGASILHAENFLSCFSFSPSSFRGSGSNVAGVCVSVVRGGVGFWSVCACIRWCGAKNTLRRCMSSLGAGCQPKTNMNQNLLNKWKVSTCLHLNLFCLIPFPNAHLHFLRPPASPPS